MKSGRSIYRCAEPEKEELISYIHQHIYEPSFIRVKNIAAHFKRNFGISYRNYLNDYRIGIIEKRLVIPTITISEIADEFGFTDESHLNKFFKTHKEIGPKAYRKEQIKFIASKS